MSDKEADDLPKGVTRNGDGSVTLMLAEPIEFGSNTVTELKIKPLKAKHFRMVPQEGRTIGHMLDMLASVCGQPKKVIDELSAEDMNGAMDALALLMGESPATGGNASG